MKSKERKENYPSIVVVILAIASDSNRLTIAARFGKVSDRRLELEVITVIGPSHFFIARSKILLAAGDMFRAAASDQLEIWAERTGCEIIVAEKEKAKASSVLSQAVKRGKDQGFDIVLCDTSGRLHTNYSLMELELIACKKVISKVVPGAPNEILLVLDGTTGLNMLPQAREFNEVVGVTGFVLTKLDGSARGGCVVSVVDELGIPVKFVGVGERVEDLQPFDAEAFVDAIFS